MQQNKKQKSWLSRAMSDASKIVVGDKSRCQCGSREFLVASKLEDAHSVMLECAACGTYRLAKPEELVAIEQSTKSTDEP